MATKKQTTVMEEQVVEVEVTKTEYVLSQEEWDAFVALVKSLGAIEYGQFESTPGGTELFSRWWAAADVVEEMTGEKV